MLSAIEGIIVEAAQIPQCKQSKLEPHYPKSRQFNFLQIDCKTNKQTNKQTGGLYSCCSPGCAVTRLCQSGAKLKLIKMEIVLLICFGGGQTDVAILLTVVVLMAIFSVQKFGTGKVKPQIIRVNFWEPPFIPRT